MNTLSGSTCNPLWAGLGVLLGHHCLEKRKLREQGQLHNVGKGTIMTQESGVLGSGQLQVVLLHLSPEIHLGDLPAYKSVSARFHDNPCSIKSAQGKNFLVSTYN